MAMDERLSAGDEVLNSVNQPVWETNARSLRAVQLKHIAGVLDATGHDLAAAARILEVSLEALVQYVRMFDLLQPPLDRGTGEGRPRPGNTG